MVDEKELFLCGFGLLGLLGSIASVIVGIFGGIFICLAAFLIYKASCYISRLSIRMGNVLSRYNCSRTVWYNSIQYGEVWLPSNVDEALERLFERILTEYVNSWYCDLSADSEFVQQIRNIIRDITSNILKRLSKVDLSEVILEDVVPIGIQHVDSYLWTLHHAKQMDSGKRKDVFRSYASFLGKNIHVALTSREAELEYLEELSKRIITLVTKKDTSKSDLLNGVAVGLLSKTVLLNLLDTISNPRTINKLLCLWFTPEPVKEYPSCTLPPVILLFRFVHLHEQNTRSTFHIDLSQILSDQELLCHFIQYLKCKGGVNLLQFCLSVEDFNKRILVEGLSDNELKSLQTEVKRLYRMYMQENSGQFIAFQSDIVDSIWNIVQADYRDVVKLRSTPALFRAYEQAYNNLADNYCPEFHLSKQYLSHVFGDPFPEATLQPYSKSSDKERPNKSKYNRLKNGLLGNPVEGSPEPSLNSAFNESSSSLQTSDDGDFLGSDPETRDLNAWRLQISRIEPRSVNGKSFFVFVIQVQRIDVTSRLDGQDLQWSVERQYHEFYALQSALTQYHGMFDDAKLPSRAKVFRGRGLDVLQSKLEPFQEYIRKLLQKESLKKSDLLFTFLTSQSEFTEAASRLGLSRIIKSVPKKLTKERGQFLQPFIQSFIQASIHTSRSSDNNEDLKPVINKFDLHSSIFKDNFAEFFPFTNSSLGPSNIHKPGGVYDIVLYVCVRILKVSPAITRMLHCVKWLVETSFNHLVNYLLSSKLATLLNNGRVTFIIDVIEEAIFTPGEEMSAEEEEIQAQKTLQLFRGYLPRVMQTLAPEGFQDGTQKIHRLLQEPRLNKQLVYTLLEAVLPRIFPELKTS